MAIKNKKGIFLADVLLSVVVMGVITTGLIQFFSSLQSEKNSPQNLAIELNFLHQKLNLVDPVSTDTYTEYKNPSSCSSTLTAGPVKSVSPSTTDILLAFPILFCDNIREIKSFGVTPVKYTHDTGLLLRIPKSHPTISCSSLLRYKFGYNTINTYSISKLTRSDRITVCDSFTNGSNWEFYLK